MTQAILDPKPAARCRLRSAAGDVNATTAFVKPNTDPGTFTRSPACVLHQVRRDRDRSNAELPGRPPPARCASLGRADVTPRKAATWDLVKVALLSPMITVIVIAVIIGIIRLLAGDGLSGLGSAVAAGWLAVNQVPVTVGGVTLGDRFRSCRPCSRPPER